MASSAMPIMSMDTGIVSSGADLVSSISSDLLADFAAAENGADDQPLDDIAPDSAVDEPIDDTTDDDAADEPTSDDTADETPDESTPSDEPAAKAPDEPAADDLPEGVSRTADASGKFRYRLDQTRYENFHGAYKALREASEVFGEPATLDSIKLRNDGYLANERMFDSLTSGDTTEQGNVVSFMLDEMVAAHQGGEVGVDPTIPFAQTVYSTLRDKAPDAYAALRLEGARDLIGEMFTAAAQANNSQLFNAAQHFAAEILGIGPKPASMSGEAYLQRVREAAAARNIPFYAPDEMATLNQTEDPVAKLARENKELRERLDGRTQTSATEQFSTWNKAHTAEVNTAVIDDAVLPALAEVKEQWKAWPKDYERLIADPLKREVTAAVRNDKALNERARNLRTLAQRATSEQVRQNYGNQIKQLFVNRAKTATDSLKTEILATGAKLLKGMSDTTHGRRDGAQTRTAPKGTSTPVPRSPLGGIPDFKDGKYDAGTAMKQMLAVLG